jgi:hypothetical protein
MANITVPGLPAKTGTILDAAYLHLNESSVDKKVTMAQLLEKIEAQYSADIVTFLGSANKAEGRANLSIDRRVTVDDANYTILATDKFIGQIGTMSTARTFSLPAASTVQAGSIIIIADESGSVNSINKIIVQRNGTDTIDGETSIDINYKYGQFILICNGTDKWKIISLGSAIAQNNISNPNLIINGQGLIGQRGTSFTSATTPANSDDTYLLDRMLLLSDGNDIVDVSQETTEVPSGSYSSIKFDVVTANKQFAYCQILEAKDAAKIIGGTASLSFKAKKGGSNATLETLRAAIISWDSTEDLVTSDVIGTWAGAGTNPTLATNWTYENTPSDLTLTTSFQTFKIENVSIDTASTNNVAVLIWCDDTDATVGDLVYIGDIKLEDGSIATPYEFENYSEVLHKCKRFKQAWGVIWKGVSGGSGYHYSSSFTFPVQMRVTPSVEVTSQTDSARYPSANASILKITDNYINYGYQAASIGGNDTWETEGFVDAEL